MLQEVVPTLCDTKIIQCDILYKPTLGTFVLLRPRVRLIYANYRKLPQTNANYRKLPQTNANYRKLTQTTAK